MFIAVIALNALASTGKLSGIGVGEVSRKYPTDITPASYAFSIWGVIYTLVGLFCVYQVLPSTQTSTVIWVDVGVLFSLSCLFNILWIVTFVQANEAATWISTIWIFGIFICLLLAHRRVDCWNLAKRSSRKWPEYIAVDLMLSLYGGWVNVACVVNVSAAFVSSGQADLGWKAANWCIFMLVIAALLNIGMLIRCNDSFWGLVFTWAAIAIAAATPTPAARDTAYVLAALVATACVVLGGFRLYKALQTQSSRLEDSQPVHDPEANDHAITQLSS